MPSNFIFFISSFSCSVIISKCCRRKWAVTSTFFIAKRVRNYDRGSFGYVFLGVEAESSALYGRLNEGPIR